MKVVSNSSENCVKNMSKLSQDMRFGRYFCLGGPNDPRFNFFVAFFEEKKARVTSWKRNIFLSVYLVCIHTCTTTSDKKISKSELPFKKQVKTTFSQSLESSAN